ncbi:DUF5317 domain-containing protein [Phosphitispora sp. TUW77]|uniref:DUF5317 domain-containing protein n=1 Tax=Phosphitispora sp. TUW77 TaxID=3152361 RepID=UPI003AB29B26
MFFELIIIALIIGLVTGGRFSRLSQLNFRFIYFIILAYLIQVGIDFGAPRWDFGGYSYLHNISYLILLFALIKNRNIPGMQIIIAGTLLNFAVIVLNNGQMPVRFDVIPAHMAEFLASGKGGTHGLISGETLLPFLADIFYIKLPYQHQLISIGDILINAGIMALIIKGLRGKTQ